MPSLPPRQAEKSCCVQLADTPILAVPEDELAGEDLDAYLSCAKCASRGGFTPGALDIDDLTQPLGRLRC